MSKKSTLFKIFLYLLFFSLSFPALRPVFASSGHYELQITDQTKYIDKYFEVDKNGNFKVNIYLGDQKLGTADDNDIYYNITDHLGSPTIITNQAGQVVETNDYESYGKIKNTDTQIDNPYKYTGKELDKETDLQYYGARYYDNLLGRFTSIDPVLTDIEVINNRISNPQNLNSYSYALNNPVNYIDPNGNEPTKAQAGIIENFINSINSSPNKVGLYKMQDAASYLAKAGQTHFNWKHFRPEPNETYYNTLETRYVYTEKGGWVDMAHFMFYAGRAYNYKLDGQDDPRAEAIQDAFQQEFSDTIFARHSAYSYEDIPSGVYGADFATKYFDPTSDLTLGEQIQDYFKNVLGATYAQNAANYYLLPGQDSKNRPIFTNRSTKPLIFND